MFELLPELRRHRKDFVVLAGNPSQKFFNHELEEMCGPNGYVSLVPDSFTRDEFKVVASNADISLGLYDQDTYGGTVARECVELGCLPLWLDNFEYSGIVRSAFEDGADVKAVLAKPDFSNFVEVALNLLSTFDSDRAEVFNWVSALRNVVRKRCSYESTTPDAMNKMNLM